MNTRIKIVYVAVSITLVVMVFIIFSTLNSRKSTDEKEMAIESELSISSEEGQVVTESGIRNRENIEKFAEKYVKDYIKAKSPSVVNIITQSIQWYFTEKNNNDNILVTVLVVRPDGGQESVMNVVEISGYKSGSFKFESMYPPDERYSIYE